ncbi:MAG: glycerol-3-phosphate 1-O-acyltransferase PlsY [Oscillospiraceae bacterium]|nr:glycerol-3-phosphate 1-O-acyltransferase PlsY [Oscillospiraceae bacterium]
MMYIIVVIIGYLLGMLSPAALLSRLKKKDLRKNGSGNLGATNTMLVLGKGYGVLVMLLDVGKAFLAVRLSMYLFPELRYAGIVAGFSAVVGHIYPFYMKFRGGKGLAAYGGMVLALKPWMFPVMLALCVAIMVITNQGVAMAVSACVLYPILYVVCTGDLGALLLLAALSVLIIINHRSNLEEAAQKKQIKVREYVKEHLLR